MNSRAVLTVRSLFRREQPRDGLIPVSPSQSTRIAPRALGVLVLLALPLFLRLWPIEHGLPRNYVPDTHCVRSALGMARDLDPVPPVGRYSFYPNLLPYLLLPVYAGEYALGRVRGEWSDAAEFGLRLREEPARAHLPARIVFALISAAAPWVVFMAGRAMGLAAGAWVGAYLVATGLLHVQFSVQERPWAPLCTFIALTAWAAALFVRSGRPAYLLRSGLAAGLAFACHQAGLLVGGLVALAWLLGPAGWRGEALRTRLRGGLACAAVFGAVALVLGYPYLIVHGGEVATATVSADAVSGREVSLGGQVFFFATRWASTVKLARSLVGYDPVLLLLALAGIAPALRSRAARPAVMLGLAWAVFFLANQGDHTRYLLPLTVLLAWPAGWAAESLLRRPATRAVLLVALALPLVQALRLGWVLRHEDTRAIAERRLARDYQDLPLAVDVRGPELPLDRRSLERLARYRPLGERERQRLATFEAGMDPPGGSGFTALPLEAIFDYHHRYRSSWVEHEEVAELGRDPSLALERLGLRLALVADVTPDDDRPALLLDPGPSLSDGRGRVWPKMSPLRVVGDPLFTIHPASGAGPVLDAHLPEELSFPLTQLWRLERPGPKLELYRLR